MEPLNDSLNLLDIMPYPAFVAESGKVTRVNNDAAKILQVGQDIAPFISVGKQEFTELTSGILYLTLTIDDLPYGASVLRTPEHDVFMLDMEIQDIQLQAMALAAQEMRKPLANLMTVSDRYFAKRAGESSPEEENYIAQMNRSLYQMLRLVGNMADANRYQKANPQQLQTWNITSLTNELFDHTAILLNASGRNFVCQRLDDFVFGMIDKEKFERALYNLISNAAKFSPEGSTITASLTRKSKMLYFTIENQCDNLTLNLQKLFTGFMRRPGIEDGRLGIGLGMMFVRSAANVHNGTVMITQPTSNTIRITFSIALKEGKSGMLHSRIPVADYAGERDHGLIELADFLPASEYIDIN